MVTLYNGMAINRYRNGCGMVWTSLTLVLAFVFIKPLVLKIEQRRRKGRT